MKALVRNGLPIALEDVGGARTKPECSVALTRTGPGSWGLQGSDLEMAQRWHSCHEDVSASGPWEGLARSSPLC